MRQIKTIKIDDREIQIKELRVKDILDLFEENKEAENFSFNDVEKFIDTSLDGITIDDFKNLAPSEIKIIWEGFKAVNAVFFEIARTAGMEEILNQIKKLLIKDFSELLVG